MPKILTKAQHGLQPLLKDRRDFSYHKTFGSAAIDPRQLPTNFVLAQPLKIKDQGDTDMCTAFASSEVAEDQDNIEMSPEWFFSKEKELLNDYAGYGADLRTACKTATKFGFLPQSNAPFSLENQPRDFLANWNNWPRELDAIAAQFKKYSYFAVENFSTDLFDSIRVTLWDNATNKESILAGSDWFAEWNGCAGGVIPQAYSMKVAQHAFKIYGWKNIGGIPYLIIQNSEALSGGDNGLLYFPREVVNKQFTYGLFCFVKQQTDYTIKTIGNPIVNFLINFFKSLWLNLHH